MSQSRTFTLNTEPHGATVGETKLLFQPEVMGDEFLDAYEQLQESQKSLDYTAVGSRILLLPETHPVTVGRLTDADLPEGMTVAEDGTALATRWIVAGKEDTEGDSDIVGDAGGPDWYYGLVERYVEQTTTTTTLAARSAAASRLRASLPVPVVVDTQQVSISPESAVQIPTLVPGWCLDVTTQVTCRPLSQRLKITGLRVAETGGTDSTPGSESVQVQVAVTGAESAPRSLGTV